MRRISALNGESLWEAGSTVVVAIFLLIAARAKQPYGYYMLLRLAATVVSAYWVYKTFARKTRGWALAFVLIALLMNPFMPIVMKRNEWQVIDTVLGILLLCWSTYWLLRGPLQPAAVPENDDASQGNVGVATKLSPDFSLDDVKALRLFCRSLAVDWWKSEYKVAAACDMCNNLVPRDEGFLFESYLFCHQCFRPAATPMEALRDLRADPDFYGSDFLEEARRFLGSERRH